MTSIFRIFFYVLTVLAFVSGPVAAGADERPRLVRVQGGGDILTLWGVGLGAEDSVVLGWNESASAEAAKEWLGSGNEPSRATAPATIPPGAREMELVQRDERGLTTNVRIPFGGRHNRPDFLAVENGNGVSPQFLISGADPYFVYPERARPGQRVRLFGVNLSSAIVGLRPVGGGEVVFPEMLPTRQLVRNARYESVFELPANLMPGDYELLAHNGKGDASAWAGGVSLEVLPVEPATEEEIFDVTDFGAKGDGIADDTAAIRRALARAEQAGGGVVYFPEGRYPISATLWTSRDVTLRGAGAEVSTIFVREASPMRWNVPPEIARQMPNHVRHRQQGPNLGVMLWLRDFSRVEHLGFEDGPGVLNVIYTGHSQVEIEHCRIEADEALQDAIVCEWGSYGFVLRHCEILASEGLFMIHGPTIQAHIAHNRLRAPRHGFPLQGANLMHVRAPERSVIEENHFSHGDRNFVSQAGGWGASLHNVIMGNIFEKGLPRRHNAGELMYEAGKILWTGHSKQVDGNVVSFEGTPFNREDFPRGLGLIHRDLEGAEPGTAAFLVVLDGRGVGQYRQIVESTEDTLTLGEDWIVPPDEDSFLAVARGYVEHLWIDNTEHATASWTGFWGVHIGHTVDGQIMRNCEGFYLWPYDQKTATLFNDVRGNWLSDRGNLVIRGRGIAFGNTYSLNEVYGFFAGPNFHGTKHWTHPHDNRVREARAEIANRAGIEIEPATPTPEWPETVGYRSWNVFDRNLIMEGPVGIRLSADSRHTLLNANVVDVRGPALEDAGEDTVVLRSFHRDEEPAPRPEPQEITHVERSGAVEVSSENIAEGAAVTASYPSSPSALERLSEGNPSGRHISGGAGPQYFQVDLGESHAMGRVQVWFYHGDRRAYEGVIVQLSGDKFFREGVTTVFNNDRGDLAGQGAGEDPLVVSTPEGLTIDFPPVPARYIRVWSNGSTANMYNHWVGLRAFAAE